MSGTYHRTVKINDNEALLNSSILKCNNGGMVSIIISMPIAIDAAAKISKNNKDEIWEHMKSEYAIGIVNGIAFTVFPSVAGLIIGSSLVTYDYVKTQESRQKDEQNNVETGAVDNAKGAIKDNSIYVATSGAGDVGSGSYNVHAKDAAASKVYAEQAKDMTAQSNKYKVIAAEREIAGKPGPSVASAKLGSELSKEAAEELGDKSKFFLKSSRNISHIFKSLKWSEIRRGVKIGASAAVVNYFIDDHYYAKEKVLQEDTKDAFYDSNLKDHKEQNTQGAILSVRG